MSWTEHARLQPIRKRFAFVDLVFDILDAYGRHRTGRNASLLAYMGILTMFPLLLVATTVLGLILEGNPELKDDIVDSAISKIPVVGTDLIQNQGDISGNWWALVVGLGVALWGALRAFVALSNALDDIWEVHDDRRDNFAIRRLRALFGILAIGLAQVGTVALAVLVSHADLPRKGQLLLILGALALNVAVVAALFRFMTTRPMSWRLVLPGAMMTGLVYTVLQVFGTRIMTRQLANASEIYGTFGGLVALGFWISIHSLVALIGAELNAALDRRRPATTGVLDDC